MNDLQLQYVRRVLGDRSLSSLGLTSVREAFVPGQPSRMELAASALDALKSGGQLTPTHKYQLESIIVRSGRPVFDVHNDSFASPGSAWPQLETARIFVESAIRAVGRVDLTGLPSVPYVGTAFLVAPDLLMTNRHVADYFASGPGCGHLKFVTGRSASVDFKQEVASEDSIRLTVTEVSLIHPHWDCALLRVQGIDVSRAPLRLAATAFSELARRDVVVIGYPAFNPSPSENPSLQIEIFRGVFQKKRLQPGKLIADNVPVTSFGHSVESLTHDCSTLGGNSGSVVLDLQTGQVVGLHFMGEYLVQNFSVPSWQLALDPRVVDFGVNFRGPASPPSSPEWLMAWKPHTAPARPSTTEITTEQQSAGTN